MAATLIEQLVALARVKLIETDPSFWTDDELVADCQEGIKDLWGAILLQNQEHFFTINDDDVSFPANSDTLTGVPDDVHKVLLIEPRDVSSSGAFRDMRFVPKRYNSPEHRANRRRDPQVPTGPLTCTYAITGAGGPVASANIYVAPQVTTAVPLTLTYIPSAPRVAADDDNPVPGESDNALVAWIVAYARAKERPDRTPDPGWLAIYGTEKQAVLKRVEPRQAQEPQTVKGVFDDLMDDQDDW